MANPAEEVHMLAAAPWARGKSPHHLSAEESGCSGALVPKRACPISLRLAIQVPVQQEEEEEECAVVVGRPLTRQCRERQEEERAIWGVVSGTELRAK